MSPGPIAGGPGKARADSTHCVHAGEERHGQRGPLATDIAQTAVFVLPELDVLRRYAEGKDHGYLYTRYANPTTEAAEKKIAALEGGEGCVVTASGMAAILVTVLATCRAGDEIVSMLDIYGGTLKLFEGVLARFGIRTRFVPYKDLGRLPRFFSKKTRMLFLVINSEFKRSQYCRLIQIRIHPHLKKCLARLLILVCFALSKSDIYN